MFFSKILQFFGLQFFSYVYFKEILTFQAMSLMTTILILICHKVESNDDAKPFPKAPMIINWDRSQAFIFQKKKFTNMDNKNDWPNNFFRPNEL